MANGNCSNEVDRENSTIRTSNLSSYLIYANVTAQVRGHSCGPLSGLVIVVEFTLLGFLKSASAGQLMSGSEKEEEVWLTFILTADVSPQLWRMNFSNFPN